MNDEEKLQRVLEGLEKADAVLELVAKYLGTPDDLDSIDTELKSRLAATGECEKCVFWELILGDTGLCRRNSPAPPGPNEDAYMWPRTDVEDWCGEFQQKRTQKESP